MLKFLNLCQYPSSCLRQKLFVLLSPFKKQDAILVLSCLLLLFFFYYWLFPLRLADKRIRHLLRNKKMPSPSKNLYNNLVSRNFSILNSIVFQLYLSSFLKFNHWLLCDHYFENSLFSVYLAIYID